MVRAGPALIVGFGLLAAACGGTYSAVQHQQVAANPIGTAMVNVGGRPETVLTDGTGRTLYLFTPEKDGKIVTTPDVLRLWHPLKLADGAAVPVSLKALAGQLGTVRRPDGGRQLTYDEWPLYTYAGDGKPGDTAGEAVGGQWFVVQASMPADADGDADGTKAQAPSPVPAAPTAAPAQPAASPAAPAPAPVFNDRDADNNGGPNDGDGRG